MDAVGRFAYRVARHPFDRWLRSRLEARDVRPDLDRLHELFTLQQTIDLTGWLTLETRQDDFRALAHGLVREVIAPELDYVPLVQVGGYVRVHAPGEALGTRFHSDTGLGHGSDEENVWIPLTPAGIRFVPPAVEIPIEAAFEQRAKEASILVTAEPGELLRFPASLIHGVLSPDAATQVSVDFRITPRARPEAVLGCRFEPLV